VERPQWVAVTEYIPKAAVRAAGIGGIADLAIQESLRFLRKLDLFFARFGSLVRYMYMKTKKAPNSTGTESREKTFLEALRADRKFRLDAGRVMRIALVAIVIEVSMLGLIRSDLADDANTHQVLVFASFVAALVILSAIGWFIVRVVDELIWFVFDRMNL